MRAGSRSLTWHDQPFRFQRLSSESHGDALWAVSRRGEFIGTMACSSEVTTKDFDVGGTRWLSELLGASTRRKALG
jgi:hypothetical protein